MVNINDTTQCNINLKYLKMINKNNLWNKVFEEDLEYIINNCRSDLKKISNKSLLFTGGGGFLGYYFYHVISKWNKENKKDNIFYTVLDNKILKKNSWITKIKTVKILILSSKT